MNAALVWFRRDLRLDDQVALAAALSRHRKVYCGFVFDRDILDPLPDRADRRVDFIHRCLVDLDTELRGRGGALIVRHGRAVEEIAQLAASLGVAAIYANRDYEPTARQRDEAVAQALSAIGVPLFLSKDQVVFEGDDILNGQGRPYAVFTPYRNAWLARLTPADCASAVASGNVGRLVPPPFESAVPTLADIGFAPTDLDRLGVASGARAAEGLLQRFLTGIDDYGRTRDFPDLDATSRLSPHLRFGTISARRLVAEAQRAGGSGAKVWLSELVWREFWQMLLWHRPDTVAAPFRREFAGLVFDEQPAWFEAWCEGRTGYPLVDAAMRQLCETGFMHNRLRMVAASFLVKDLGIDWRLGEAWFARWLLDYDQASNVGNWQWCASVGCDAQPWFRIFNPLAQSKKFDPAGHFIRRFVPELAGVSEKDIHAPWLSGALVGDLFGDRGYPPPIVDHAKARERTLARYRNAGELSEPPDA